MAANIEIIEDNAAWLGQFLAERKILQAALSPWLVGDIEHIGSTAVPGLAAKAVIDIMAPVASLEGSWGRSRLLNRWATAFTYTNRMRCIGFANHRQTCGRITYISCH